MNQNNLFMTFRGYTMISLPLYVVENNRRRNFHNCQISITAVPWWRLGKLFYSKPHANGNCDAHQAVLFSFIKLKKKFPNNMKTLFTDCGNFVMRKRHKVKLLVLQVPWFYSFTILGILEKTAFHRISLIINKS